MPATPGPDGSRFYNYSVQLVTGRDVFPYLSSSVCGEIRYFASHHQRAIPGSPMLKKVIYYLFIYPFYKMSFAKMGSRSWLVRAKVDGYKRISIGSNVYINDSTWLASMPLPGTGSSSLSIGDDTYIGRFCHFYATSNIEIGKKVLIADRVYLADNMHQFEDVNTPVIDQPVKQTGEVLIGDGAWLGENVCVIGAKVGKHSVVGANAVVMKDIPDYCVAVGSPAKIIKRYSFEKKEWIKTNEQGELLI